MFNNFGFISSKVLKDAENERFSLKHPYVGTEHLLLAILKSNTELQKKLAEYNLTYQSFRDELIKIVGMPKKNIDINLYTPLLKRVLSSALSDAKENNEGKVTENHLLIAMLDEGEGIAIRIMIGMSINIDELYDELKVKPSSLNQSKLEIYNVGTVYTSPFIDLLMVSFGHGPLITTSSSGIIKWLSFIFFALLVTTFHPLN